MKKVMYRASVFRRADRFGGVDYSWARWNIPVLFRSRDEAIRAACVAAKRKIERHGGEWSIDIEERKVAII